MATPLKEVRRELDRIEDRMIQQEMRDHEDGLPPSCTPFETLLEEEQAAYEAWLYEQPEYWEQFIPMKLPREHGFNRCDNCGCSPTADNPAYAYAGDPPDLENGPKAADLPFVICERCDSEIGF